MNAGPEISSNPAYAKCIILILITIFQTNEIINTVYFLVLTLSKKLTILLRFSSAYIPIP